MSPTRPPVTIVVAAALAALEALALLVLAVVQVASLDGSSAGVGVAWAVFFVLCSAGLGWCAWGLSRRHSWGRAPIVLVQLIMLGLAWDGRHNAPLAVALVVVAAATLVTVFHPASLAALEPDED